MKCVRMLRTIYKIDKLGCYDLCMSYFELLVLSKGRTWAQIGVGPKHNGPKKAWDLRKLGPVSRPNGPSGPGTWAQTSSGPGPAETMQERWLLLGL